MKRISKTHKRHDNVYHMKQRGDIVSMTVAEKIRLIMTRQKNIGKLRTAVAGTMHARL